MGKYEKALRDGREIVVVSKWENFNSSVFWFNGETLFTFSRAFGVVPRSDITFSDLEKHLLQMGNEGSVFIRGDAD